MTAKGLVRYVARRISGLPVERSYKSLAVGKCADLDPNLEIHVGHVTIDNYTYIGSGRISSLSDTLRYSWQVHVYRLGRANRWTLHKSHPTNYSLTRLITVKERESLNHGVSCGHITIGNDVSIGTSATMPSGVTITDGAIAGAGPVVTRDIPPSAVAADVPTPATSRRFLPEEIGILAKVTWWDWGIEQIKRNAKPFCGEASSARAFIAKAD